MRDWQFSSHPVIFCKYSQAYSYKFKRFFLEFMYTVCEDAYTAKYTHTNTGTSIPCNWSVFTIRFKTHDSLVVQVYSFFRYTVRSSDVERDKFSHFFDENSIQFTFSHLWSHSIFLTPATQAGYQYSHHLTYGWLYTH